MAPKPKTDIVQESIVESHIRAFLTSFPDAIREQTRTVHRTQYAMDAARRDYGHRRKSKASKEICEELYQASVRDQNKAMELYSKFQEANVDWNAPLKLRQQTINAFAKALQSAHDAGEFQIREMFNADYTQEERQKSYRRVAQMLDETNDNLHKLKKVSGEFYFSDIKSIEAAQLLFRNSMISQLLQVRKEARTHTHRSAPPRYYKIRAQDQQDKIDIVPQILLFRIKGANPKNGHTTDNNQIHNFANIVPETVGSLFGGQPIEATRLDDAAHSLPPTFEWEKSYEEIYEGTFRPIDNLHQLFDFLDTADEGTLGVLSYIKVGPNKSHALVVGNICGVSCIIDAQNARVIIRNPATHMFESQEINSTHDGHTFKKSGYDPGLMTDLQFLDIKASYVSTEFNRAQDVKDHLLGLREHRKTRYNVMTDPSSQHDSGMPITQEVAGLKPGERIISSARLPNSGPKKPRDLSSR